jgi:serine/threonine protein kinase
MSDWDILRKTYKLKGNLGAGTYGTVALVKHRETKKVYAAKHLKNFIDSKYRSKMVLRELELMIQLSNMKNNIFTTKIHDVILAGDNHKFTSLFIVMDYVEQDLSSMIQDQTIEFERDHAITILYNILCGVKFLNTANIIHRDLNPRNILVSNDC